MIGIRVDELTCFYGDDQSVLANTSNPGSTLTKTNGAQLYQHPRQSGRSIYQSTPVRRETLEIRIETSCLRGAEAILRTSRSFPERLYLQSEYWYLFLFIFLHIFYTRVHARSDTRLVRRHPCPREVNANECIIFWRFFLFF